LCGVVRRTYVLQGVVQVCAGYFGYFMTFWYAGFVPTRMWQMQTDWGNAGLNITNDYGDVIVSALGV
jgi:hypothetical protein